MFEQNLKYGKIAESVIAGWFRDKGYSVLPIYEKEIGEGKGPAIFFPDAEIIGTDMMVFNQQCNKVYWIEAKHKTAFTWHRISSRWVTGIDLKHYHHYQVIANRTIWPVWILFFHEGGQAKDSPSESPSGLFGNDLRVLINNENHKFPGKDRNGKNIDMVYWAHDKLHKIATLEELRKYSKAS